MKQGCIVPSDAKPQNHIGNENMMEIGEGGKERQAPQNAGQPVTIADETNDQKGQEISDVK